MTSDRDKRPHHAWRRVSYAGAAAFALLLAASPPAHAQGGVIAGTVIDARSLRGLDGAQVSVEATTLGALAPGDRVNVETDILARHVARLQRFHTGTAAAGTDPSTLRPTDSEGAPA